MNLADTIKGSLLEDFYPKGWNLEKIDQCVGTPDSVLDRQPHWNKDFTPVCCDSLHDFEVMMGHEIAMQIRMTKAENRKAAFILPAGPMGMYRWAVFFLKEWEVDCYHVTTFNMDEWADTQGVRCLLTIPPRSAMPWNSASFIPSGILLYRRRSAISPRVTPCPDIRKKSRRSRRKAQS